MKAGVFAFDGEQASTRERDYQRECREKIVERLGADGAVLLHLATGGGKTLVANNAVRELVAARGGYALWVTKDWWLLHQAAMDTASRHEGMAERLRRIGGGTQDLAELPELSAADDAAGIVYTTLHTFKRRLDDGRLPPEGPSVIVWDECHWGYGARTGRALRRWAKEGRVPMLGLTATPGGESDFEPACTHTFADLEGRGHLAKPKVVSVRTSAKWHPVRRWSETDAGDFTEESLRQLAENERRNDEIVQEYRGRAVDYGKTIVFACDITHAEHLVELFCRAGVAAASVHSRLTREENEANLRDFREGSVRVLVNVVKMTHGVDVPDTKTVFLCRPTASCVLLSQMIGRGARVDESTGKKSFYIVEFIDMADQMENIRHARDCGFGPREGSVRRDGRKKPVRCLEFDRTGAPRWTGDSEDLPDAVKNLWYREGQSFSVAFDLTSREDRLAGDSNKVNERWARVTNALRRALRREFGAERVAAGAGDDEIALAQWEIVPDEAGWQVASPPLSGRDGMVELHLACVVLSRTAEDLGVWIDYRTGTNLQLGWLTGAEDAIRAVKWTHMLEPVLRSLVRPSRFARYNPEEDVYETDRPNEDCLPVADVYPLDQLDEETAWEDLRQMSGDRNASLSLAPLINGQPQVEVRLLGGTTESERVLRWLTLWMRILWAAETDGGRLSEQMLEDPAGQFPSLSVRRAMDLIGVPEEREDYVGWLEERQHQILDLWHQRPELEGWLPMAASGRTFERALPAIGATLGKHGLRSAGSFEEMPRASQRCAVWCVLSGEGPLARDERPTVDLVARRLRAQGVADFRRLREDGGLYGAIQEVFESASQAGDGWLEWPRGPLRRVRAYRAVTEMTLTDWGDCVIRTMREWYPDGAGTREWVIRDAFKMACERYGIRTAAGNPCEKITRRIRDQIELAIDQCIGDGYIGSVTEGLELQCDYSAEPR